MIDCQAADQAEAMSGGTQRFHRQPQVRIVSGDPGEKFFFTHKAMPVPR